MVYLSEIAAAFKIFDKNGDGTISAEELGEAMKQAGQAMSDGELKEFIKAVDRDGNNKLTTLSPLTDYLFLHC